MYALFPQQRYQQALPGANILQQNDAVAEYADMEAGCLHLQYEGLNPSGSFKDNGMTAAFTHARTIGAQRTSNLREKTKILSPNPA